MHSVKLLRDHLELTRYGTVVALTTVATGISAETVSRCSEPNRIRSSSRSPNLLTLGRKAPQPYDTMKATLTLSCMHLRPVCRQMPSHLSSSTGRVCYGMYCDERVSLYRHQLRPASHFQNRLYAGHFLVRNVAPGTQRQSFHFKGCLIVLENDLPCATIMRIASTVWALSFNPDVLTRTRKCWRYNGMQLCSVSVHRLRSTVILQCPAAVLHTQSVRNQFPCCQKLRLIRPRGSYIIVNNACKQTKKTIMTA